MKALPPMNDPWMFPADCHLRLHVDPDGAAFPFVLVYSRPCDSRLTLSEIRSQRHPLVLEHIIELSTEYIDLTPIVLRHLHAGGIYLEAYAMLDLALSAMPKRASP